ncbi:hypothetical protein DFH07DRAFT_854585 [Mycena maculata]|uniref:Uncharacterized protein n=1 Tax=Mycena maculata TaxID=230809 RepID=A0AAD7MNY6_9AGAR|nr:hypothetical protein DFH07DRAFT_854585 [Mycena maculata]
MINDSFVFFADHRLAIVLFDKPRGRFRPIQNKTAHWVASFPSTIMSTKSESSVVTNPDYSSAKSQTKPMTAISAPHPLLKSSRGRVLWSDQRPTTEDKKRGAAFHGDLDDSSVSQTRQRTSSVTSIETIRPKVKARVADVLLKPQIPLNDATIPQRSTRKRTHSATSPEVNDDDSGAHQIGPRVRQRRDSDSMISTAPPDVDEDPQATLRAKLPLGASSALKKLKEKLTLVHTSGASASEAPREPRPSLSSKATSSVAHISRTADASPPSPQPVAFPATGTGSPRSKPAPLVVDLPPDAKAEPLQSLSTNTESRRTPIRRPIPGARLSKYGCYQLKASEFELAVTFPSSARSNFEVWDQEDELFLVGPLSLHLTLKDPAKWEGVPVSHPDVSVLEIKCTSKAVVDSPAVPYAAIARGDKYSVHYAGAKTRSARGAELAIDPAEGIAVDTVWLRTYAADPAEGASTGRRGWEMRFFVPVATRLFERRETRVFKVEGLISVAGDRLATEITTMSVSHLMREREMVRR